MPKQGLQMTEGTIVQWLVEEGGEVKTGEPLFEIETDKVVITIDAETSGTLLKMFYGEGDTVPVAEMVAVIGEPGEDYPALLSQPAHGKEGTLPAATSETSAASSAAAAAASPAASSAAAARGKRLFASPRARMIAEEHGVALLDVSGAGLDGMITEKDIYEFLGRHIKQYKVFRPEDIKPFGEGNYQSRLLLDSLMAGEKCVNVNHGTFAPGAGIMTGNPVAAQDGPGTAHEKAEIYFGVYGEADVYIEGDPVYMTRGTLIYIPGGFRHYVVNRSLTERFELLTIWADEKDNDMHAARVEAWGTSYKRAGE